MNFCKRFWLKRKIRKIIYSLDDTPLSTSVLNVVMVFKRLDRPTLMKVWGYRHTGVVAEYRSLGDLLQVMSHGEMACGDLTPTTEKRVIDPLEWVSGAPREKVLTLMADPRLPALGDIAATVWYRLVSADFSTLTAQQTAITQIALRGVLKGMVKCL